MSGIGKVPKLQPNALVFGFFMDGMQSQTPVVVGSLPHIEIPTYLQDQQQNEDVGDDSKPSNVFQSFAGFFAPKFDVDDENNISDAKTTCIWWWSGQSSKIRSSVLHKYRIHRKPSTCIDFWFVCKIWNVNWWVWSL